jgi:hypothetical protein
VGLACGAIGGTYLLEVGQAASAAAARDGGLIGGRTCVVGDQDARKLIHRQQVEHDDDWSEAEDHGHHILMDVKLPVRRVISIGSLITHGVPHGLCARYI